MYTARRPDGTQHNVEAVRSSARKDTKGRLMGDEVKQRFNLKIVK